MTVRLRVHQPLSRLRLLKFIDRLRLGLPLRCPRSTRKMWSKSGPKNCTQMGVCVSINFHVDVELGIVAVPIVRHFLDSLLDEVVRPRLAFSKDFGTTETVKKDGLPKKSVPPQGASAQNCGFGVPCCSAGE